MLGVGAGQHLLGMGDPRDQVAHLALDLGHLGDQPRRAGGLGERRCESGCRRAGTSSKSGRRRPSARPARRARRGRRSSARSAASIAEPTSIATRWSSTAQASRPSGSPRARRAAAGRRRRCRPSARGPTSGGPTGPASSAPGAGSSARSAAPRRARRSGGSLLPGARRPTRIAVPEPLDRLLERGRRPDRLKHRLDGGIALHGPNLTPPAQPRAGRPAPAATRADLADRLLVVAEVDADHPDRPRGLDVDVRRRRRTGTARR